MKRIILPLLALLVLLLCSCSLPEQDASELGTLRIVGIGASGLKIKGFKEEEKIEFPEYDIYYTMQGFVELGKRAGYNNIEYYECFPEQTLDNNHQFFAGSQYNSYTDLMDALKANSFSSSDFTIVLISSHGGYNGTIIDCGSDYALNSGFILAAQKKSDNTIERKDFSFSTLNSDLNSLGGTVLALVQVCFSGGMIVGDSVIANTDVYPQSSVLENLFKTGDEKISDHVFYLCSSPYYSMSVGSNYYHHTYFFAAVQKAIGMNLATFKMETPVTPVESNGIITLSGLTRYVLNNGGVYDGSKSSQENLKEVDQFPVVSGGSSDLVIFRFY